MNESGKLTEVNNHCLTKRDIALQAFVLLSYVPKPMIGQPRVNDGAH